MKQNEMLFFKDFLEQRKQAILDNLQSNFKEIEALHNSTPSDNVDFSTIESSSQVDFLISANLKQELKEIENSLKKIANQNFGICESCNESIDIERLKIKPHAKYCIACRENIEKGEL